MADLIFANERLEFIPYVNGLHLWQTWGTDNLVPFELAAGETYTVSWDGMEYPCVAVTNGELFGVGNLFYGELGEDTGEPFVIGINADGSNTFILTPESGTHSIEIYRGVPDEGIVLKDRNGTDLVFKGKEKVKIPTESGGKQIFSRGEAITNVPIELDFSGGNQSVTAPAGQLVKSAVIYKPDGLVPENIAEGVDIAGVLGTLAAGGGGGDGGGSGGMTPLMWVAAQYQLRRHYNSTAGSQNYSLLCTVPKGAVIHAYLDFYDTAHSTSSSGTVTTNGDALIQSGYDSFAENVSGSMNLTDTYSIYLSKTSYNALVFGALIVYSLPGIYVYQGNNGNLSVYADETATQWPTGFFGAGLASPAIRAVKHIDLSNSNITALGGYAFGYSGASEILLPGTIETVNNSAFSNCTQNATQPVIVDFSKHTFVPTISSTFYGTTGLKIRVPAALYDEWIADSNWKYGASYIEAV